MTITMTITITIAIAISNIIIIISSTFLTLKYFYVDVTNQKILSQNLAESQGPKTKSSHLRAGWLETTQLKKG